MNEDQARDMSQPRFKFTDFLTVKGGTRSARNPLGIYVRDGEFNYYFHETEASYKEDELEIFQEPKKKKLYAYRLAGRFNEIKTYVEELDQDIAEANYLSRMPDYDIEYPEAK